MRVGAVLRGSPAERAGLRPGDWIVAIDGRKLEDLRPLYESIVAGQDDVVELTVEQPGSPGEQRRLQLVLRDGKPMPNRTTGLEDLLDLFIDYYPLGFLVVGLGVLLLRADDRNAWLLALLFGGFLALAPLFEGNIPSLLRGFVVFYKIVMSWSSLALFYYFFAVFPASSPIDRKVPWLKYVLLAAAIIITVPIGFRCLVAGGSSPLYLGLHWPGTSLISLVFAQQNGLPAPASQVWRNPAFVFLGFFLAAMALGLTSLVSNNFLSADAQVRRRAHFMLWGTAIGVAPICLAGAVALGVGFVKLPLAVWQVSILFLSFVWPLSFAYAVVKHRVLEIPVLLKRSARYLLVQRGFTILLLAVWLAAIRLFTYAVSGLLGTFSNAVLALALAFGIGLVWISAPTVNRTTARIDRAFFRSAYDTRLILQELAEKTRSVTNRHELARLLEIQIAGALHPKSLGTYLDTGDGNLVAEPAPVSQQTTTTHIPLPRPAFPVRFGAMFVPRELNAIPATMPLLQEIVQRGKAWDVPPAHEAAGDLGPLAPECVVPILGRNSRLFGLLILGPRLSEEPYSSEDKHLLDFVASQAGITLENIDLAEKIAERMEAERRASRDMEIAKQVQARLFPQKLPPLDTLEYAGRCIQARDVGGDYYDFLSLSPGRMGIVIADIVGKGIPGALLMANLQADVRSQCAMAPQDLLQFLKSVNQSFYESTDLGTYATLFFGDYQDSTHRLRFANCGHNPPFLVRSDGTVNRLAATATVLGLFEEWESSICDVQISAGDLLVIYTDGITEAENVTGEQFGEDRLLEAIRAHLALPVPLILDAILSAALDFSGGEGKMRDDLTLLVARGR